MAELYFNENADENESADPYEALAEMMTASFKADPCRFLLTQPVSLTVSLANGEFTKMSHIGGEEMTLVKSYVGKRKSLIYVFKPTVAIDYEFAEISHNDAKKCFGKSFALYVNRHGAGRVDELVAEAKKAAATAREAKANESKVGTYAQIGWGDF